MAICVVMLRVHQLLFIFMGLFSTYSPILNGVVAFYPASGLRASASGGFWGAGVEGDYWFSAVSGVSASILRFASLNVNPPAANSRAWGFSVRCVQNLRYICLVLCVL